MAVPSLTRPALLAHHQNPPHPPSQRPIMSEAMLDGAILLVPYWCPAPYPLLHALYPHPPRPIHTLPRHAPPHWQNALYHESNVSTSQSVTLNSQAQAVGKPPRANFVHKNEKVQLK